MFDGVLARLFDAMFGRMLGGVLDGMFYETVEAIFD